MKAFDRAFDKVFDKVSDKVLKSGVLGQALSLIGRSHG
jgi:hypothetical protein